jgi:hypothetical protein
MRSTPSMSAAWSALDTGSTCPVKQ